MTHVKHKLDGNWQFYFTDGMVSACLQVYGNTGRARTERIGEILESICRYLLTKLLALRKD